MPIELPAGRAEAAEHAINEALGRIIDKADELAVYGWLPLRVDAGVCAGDMAAMALVNLSGLLDGVDIPRYARCSGCGKMVPFDATDLRKLRLAKDSNIVAEIVGVTHCGRCDMAVVIRYENDEWFCVPEVMEHLH